jgi:hypothetical protein
MNFFHFLFASTKSCVDRSDSDRGLYKKSPGDGKFALRDDFEYLKKKYNATPTELEIYAEVSGFKNARKRRNWR